MSLQVKKKNLNFDSESKGRKSTTSKEIGTFDDNEV